MFRAVVLHDLGVMDETQLFMKLNRRRALRARKQIKRNVMHIGQGSPACAIL
jgi:hypothetical protein